MNLRQYQQGDINISEITEEQYNSIYPTDYRGVPLKPSTNIVSESAVTGHKHVVQGGEVSRLTRSNSNIGHFPQEVLLTHDEHKPIAIPAGYWLFSHVFEFDALRGQDTFVVD